MVLDLTYRGKRLFKTNEKLCISCGSIVKLGYLCEVCRCRKFVGKSEEDYQSKEKESKKPNYTNSTFLKDYVGLETDLFQKKPKYHNRISSQYNETSRSYFQNAV